MLDPIEYANVIFGVDKTESEIANLGLNSIIKGQMWIASDTKRIIGRDLSGNIYYPTANIGGDVPSDGKYYVRSDGNWIDITDLIGDIIPVDWTSRGEDDDFIAEHRTIHLVSTDSVTINSVVPDATATTFETRIIKITDIPTPSVDIVTVGGQEIGGETVQTIYGSSEGVWLLSNTDSYVLIQDNRGAVARKLSQSTSIISGFDVTLNGNNTINIGEGIYVIEDPQQLFNPISSPKLFPGINNYVITGALSRGATTIYLTTSNTIQQLLNDTPTPEVQITQPRIAVMVHLTSAAIVTETAYWWTTGNNPSSRVNALLEFMGVMKKGIVVAGDVAGNLKIQHSSGSIYAPGLETNFTPKRPDEQYVVAQMPVPGMLYATQTTIFDPITDIDPTVYDLSGTLTSVGGSNSQCSIWRIITLFNGGIAVQPGQITYATQVEAIDALTRRLDPFVPNPIIDKFSIVSAYLIVEKGATDLTASGDATFVTTDRWGDNS